MKMHARYLLCTLTALVLVVPAVRAETPATEDSIAELKKGQDALRDELKAVREDLKVLLREMQALKKSQQRAAKPRSRPAMDLLGKPAPKHTVKTYQGEEITLGGSSDDVTVAMFYATWCGYCKRTLPGISKLHETYKDKNVNVVTINLDDAAGKRAKTDEQVIEQYEKLKLTAPMFRDGKKAVGKDYKVSSYPTSFVIAKDGTVQAVHIGGPKDLDQQIAAEVDKLLEGKTLVEAKKS